VARAAVDPKATFGRLSSCKHQTCNWDADRVVIDRPKNPHVAFGLGIHRCIGSNLARMEINVALQEWLACILEFRLDPGIDFRSNGRRGRGVDRGGSR
jgi:cytochrome P450